MNCCGNHDHNEKDQDKGNMNHPHQIKKRNWMMILCCVLPIVLFVAILLANLFTDTSTNIMPYLILLICPLSHLILMPLMMGKKKY